MKEIQERVRHGLMNMKKAPDAFLFSDGGEETWDLPDILGIPVFHTTSVGDYLTGTVRNESLFIPIWKDEATENGSERNRFIEGYDEFIYIAEEKL